MIQIAIGGLEKKRIEAAILEHGEGRVNPIVTTDMAAAREIKAGKVDYYFGACNSGGGAAISILIGMVGYSKCCTVAKNGQRAKEEDVKKYLEEGKICFGMAVENIEDTVAVLVRNILAK